MPEIKWDQSYRNLKSLGDKITGCCVGHPQEKSLYLKKNLYMITGLGVYNKIMDEVPGISAECGEMTRNAVDDSGRPTRW